MAAETPVSTPKYMVAAVNSPFSAMRTAMKPVARVIRKFKGLKRVSRKNLSRLRN